MEHKEHRAHDHTKDDRNFFLVVGITVVTLAIGLMMYYLFNAASQGSNSLTSNTTSAQEQRPQTEQSPTPSKVDPALQNVSFSEEEKVRLVVGYNTPNSAEVLEELQNDEYTITRFYWNEPVFGVEVNESGYKKLMVSPKVSNIQLDKNVKTN